MNDDVELDDDADDGAILSSEDPGNILDDLKAAAEAATATDDNPTRYKGFGG
jgi:hypothetical protein